MRRRVGLFLTFGLLLPLALAAQASAQGAVLRSHRRRRRQARRSRSRAARSTPSTGNVGGVNIRLSTRDSTVLGNSSVSPQSTISATVPRSPTR